MKILDRKTKIYEIVGDNLEMLKVKVIPQYKLFAEAGKMVYIRGNVEMESRLPEKGGLLDKIVGMGKRLLAGESLFWTYYEGEGEVGFAGNFPGRILPIGLENTAILAQRDAFIAGIGDIDISIALQKRIKGAFWGGEGLILEKIAGQSVVFIHAGGELVSFDLTPGETIQVDTGSAVAWDESVVYDVRRVKSLKTALFGGEGIFLTSLTGPGTVIIQTMTLSKLRCQIGQTSSESKK